MQLRRSNDEIIIDQLDVFTLELLRMIPVSTTPDGCPDAEDRLFSNPESVPSQFAEDWESYVKPELRHLFQSAIEVVESDLKTMDQAVETSNGPHELRVPQNHYEAWVSAINQARLVRAAKFRFNREGMEYGMPESIESPRDRALLQMDVYDFLLLCFVQALE